MDLEERFASWGKIACSLITLAYITLGSCGCASCPEGMERISPWKHGFGPYILDQSLFGREYIEKQD